ncbi:MAG: hypothetical protein ACUVT6_13550, partial [Thermodesulfobacteriota bacterium]
MGIAPVRWTWPASWGSPLPCDPDVAASQPRPGSYEGHCRPWRSCALTYRSLTVPPAIIGPSA